MRTIAVLIVLGLGLAACDPAAEIKPKAATYDPVKGAVVMPNPCPDWSKSATVNYENQLHSNFGCAVNGNKALQLAYPEEMIAGHGNDHPDIESTTRTIERYRSGEIPLPLTPTQTTGTGQ